MARGLKRIEQMYAFVYLDPADNTEGVPAIAGPGGAPIAMVAADWRRVQDLRPAAQPIARQLGGPITLCRFEVRTEVETFEP